MGHVARFRRSRKLPPLLRELLYRRRLAGGSYRLRSTLQCARRRRLLRRLLDLSTAICRCTYEILHIDAEWRNYVAQMQLLPVTESNQCFGQWWATFDVPADQEVEACQRVADTFRIFFQCVDQRFGGR